MLTRCNTEYAPLDSANSVGYTFEDHSFEGLLLVRTESKVDDAIDFSKVSEFLPHVGQSLKNLVVITIVTYLMKHNQSRIRRNEYFLKRFSIFK